MEHTPPAEYHMTPGYMIIPKKPTLVSGVVGSGLFVSLWDHQKRYSGCCCYQHPRATDMQQAKTANIGEAALPHLITSMQKIGSLTKDLRAFIIGGGVRDGEHLGERNRNVAHEILSEHEIEVFSEDTGGSLGRKFIYNSETGENVVMKVHMLRKEDWRP